MRKAAAMAIAIVLAVPATAAAADTKIGYVDIQRALNEVDDGRDAKAKLKKEFDEKQRALDEKQEELKVMQEELQKQEMMLSPEAKQEKLNVMQKKMLELQQTYMTLQRDLSQREAEMTKPIFERMNVMLNKIAEDENYSIILERNESSILYARSYMDLTNELVRKYNDQLAKEKGTSPKKDGAKKEKKKEAPATP